MRKDRKTELWPRVLQFAPSNRTSHYCSNSKTFLNVCKSLKYTIFKEAKTWNDYSGTQTTALYAERVRSDLQSRSSFNLSIRSFTRGMAQVESHDSINCTLDYEELLAVLEAEDGIERVLPHDTLESTPCALPSNPVSGRKRSRVYPSTELATLRHEAMELRRQLQILKEKHDFCESLKPIRSRCAFPWKLFVAREQAEARKAGQVNARLRKLIANNIRLIQRIERIPHQQSMPPAVEGLNDRIADLDHQDRVYRELQTRLDFRSQFQVESIEKQCADGPAQINNWRAFELGDRSVCVEFQESVTMPFRASSIIAIAYRYPLLNALEVCENKFVDKITHEPIPVHSIPRKATLYLPTATDRRLILRRLVNATNSTILLWEDASCWKGKGTSPSAFIRGSGWALVSPVVGRADKLSVIQCGGLIQIKAMREECIKPGDALVKDIMAYTQSLQRSRIESLEDILLDASRDQTKTRHCRRTSGQRPRARSASMRLYFVFN